MDNVIKALIQNYNPKNDNQAKQALREVMQEIVLAGLSRSDFFEKAAFYGGTCLRIFHGLNRFSEDLDFACISKDRISIEEYFSYIKNEFLSFGIDVNLRVKKKEEQGVQSAFIDSNTQILLLEAFSSDLSKNVIDNEKIKIKIEIDLDNPDGGTFERKYKMIPSPYQVTIFDESSLFAGKIHAIICRNYKNRAKGRDYYDYLFYVSKGSSINIKYLENKLKNSGKLSSSDILTLDKIKDLLRNRFLETNYELAVKDTINFVESNYDFSNWNKDFFISTLDYLK